MSGSGHGGGGKNRTAQGGRHLAKRVKSARGRTLSSTRWLQRQLNDPYVARARSEGYRSRAAYKLIEMDDRFRLFSRGDRVVDLGAAPGGWTQVAVERVRAQRPGQVVAVDLAHMDPVPDATTLHLDFLAEGAEAAVTSALDGKADLVLSDMASPSTGIAHVDRWRVMALCEAAAEFAVRTLAVDGCFVSKTLRGGEERALIDMLRSSFRKVRNAKPSASRADSAEMYIVALGFRGTSDLV